MRRTVVVLALAALLVVSLAFGQAQVRWDMPTPYGDGTFHTRNIRQFADDLNRLTAGRLQITVHSAGSLFRHTDIKPAVRGAQVPIGEVLVSLLASEDPVFALDSIPFLATSYAEARRLYEVSRPALEARLAREGLKLLFAVPWPPQGFYTSRPVQSLADTRGMRFRAYNPLTSRLAELMGMVPTQIEVPEVPQAFATGIIQAMVTSPTTGVDTSAWDYVPNFYHTQAWLPKNMIFVNQRLFDGLPADVRDALLRAAADAERRGWEMSEAETDAQLEVLRRNGMTVSPPSAQLAAELARIGETMTEEWLRTAGAEGRAIVDAYRRAAGGN